MGLLDNLIDPRIAAEMGPSEQERAQAKNQALMMAGLGMIGQRGGFGAAVSNGGMAGLQSYQQALENSRRAKMQQFQQGVQMQGILDEQKKRKAIEEAMQNASPEERHAMSMGVSPTEIWKRRNPEDQYKVVGNSMVQVGGGKVNPVFTAPEKMPDWAMKDANGNRVVDPNYLAMRRQIAETQASFNRPPAQPMQPVAYVDETGKTVWGTITEAKGKPAANFSPMIQGAITGARKDAELTAAAGSDAKKAIKKSDEFLSVAQQANSLLDKGPTQSGIGSAVDAAGRMVGVSTDSGKTAAELDALSGWMVANVPRMEGPQSNFDVDNYKTMAGKVGDRTVPIAERKAALKQVMTLQNKYKHLNQADQAPQEKTVVRRGKYGGKTVVEYSDGSVSYAD